MSWRISRAWHYSQMAQAGSEWELGLGRHSVGRAAGGGAEGRRRVK